jgi:class 3 adenylate cyclase
LTSHRELPDIAEPKPYSSIELAKHIDPTLLEDLGRLTLQDRPIEVRLTVVFWDISGFSDLCKILDPYPESILVFLDEYFKKAIKIIKKHQGVLDKFMGDGILAYFGYNGMKNGDPFNALNAALEFKKQFTTFKKWFVQLCKNTYGIDVKSFDLKCGINNGPAYVYYFNTPMRNSVILLGSTLNLASRLEGIARFDEIIVSRELKNMVERKYEVTEIPVESRVKGGIKSYEKVDFVYAVEGKKSRARKERSE